VPVVSAATEPEFAKAALETVAKWRYQPPVRAGRPVVADETLAIQFGQAPRSRGGEAGESDSEAAGVSAEAGAKTHEPEITVGGGGRWPLLNVSSSSEQDGRAAHVADGRGGRGRWRRGVCGASTGASASSDVATAGMRDDTGDGAGPAIGPSVVPPRPASQRREPRGRGGCGACRRGARSGVCRGPRGGGACRNSKARRPVGPGVARQTVAAAPSPKRQALMMHAGVVIQIENAAEQISTAMQATVAVGLRGKDDG